MYTTAILPDGRKVLWPSYYFGARSGVPPWGVLDANAYYGTSMANTQPFAADGRRPLANQGGAQWAGTYPKDMWDPLTHFRGYPAAPRRPPISEGIYMRTVPQHNELGYQMVALRDNGVPIGGTPETTPNYVFAGPVQIGYMSAVRPIARREQMPGTVPPRVPNPPALPSTESMIQGANSAGYGVYGGGPYSDVPATAPGFYPVRNAVMGGWPTYMYRPVGPAQLPKEQPPQAQTADVNPASPALVAGLGTLAALGVAGAAAWHFSKKEPDYIPHVPCQPGSLPAAPNYHYHTVEDRACINCKHLGWHLVGSSTINWCQKYDAGTGGMCVCDSWESKEVEGAGEEPPGISTADFSVDTGPDDAPPNQSTWQVQNPLLLTHAALAAFTGFGGKMMTRRMKRLRARECASPGWCARSGFLAQNPFPGVGGNYQSNIATNANDPAYNGAGYGPGSYVHNPVPVDMRYGPDNARASRLPPPIAPAPGAVPACPNGFHWSWKAQACVPHETVPGMPKPHAPGLPRPHVPAPVPELPKAPTPAPGAVPACPNGFHWSWKAQACVPHETVPTKPRPLGTVRAWSGAASRPTFAAMLNPCPPHAGNPAAFGVAPSAPVRKPGPSGPPPYPCESAEKPVQTAPGVVRCVNYYSGTCPPRYKHVGDYGGKPVCRPPDPLKERSRRPSIAKRIIARFRNPLTNP
jgi:hypothetical protein